MVTARGWLPLLLLLLGATAGLGEGHPLAIPVPVLSPARGTRAMPRVGTARAGTASSSPGEDAWGCWICVLPSPRTAQHAKELSHQDPTRFAREGFAEKRACRLFGFVFRGYTRISP